ncbi:hypothetical protein TOT_010001258 [Theileria orientalis strain Shintoku]|uniref:Uncharacterized protein n=1 Tax=Theileria orientalis strain Shintoku TaxID=869250 RepID=J4C7F6_THEOR|nr:hypothetical protein TOT_010001258 [Theileria orientalis strain Shintoku]PVC53173.1 hypothetical protein MACL_00000239 [Theileria orientalis]BAM38953.1 hypothetical protein TOT_010001258 [Theileria orientalis strain Shintoku]|eukprot:XP_009689254.1 hypothetical protein TOT_010001258 [Theileria orientalis strain Shintoku]
MCIYHSLLCVARIYGILVLGRLITHIENILVSLRRISDVKFKQKSKVMVNLK